MEEKSTFWVIDRIEGGPAGDLAVIEIAEGKTVTVPLTSLPDGASQGNVIRLVIDREEEARRRKKLRSLFSRLRVD